MAGIFKIFTPCRKGEDPEERSRSRVAKLKKAYFKCHPEERQKFDQENLEETTKSKGVPSSRGANFGLVKFERSSSVMPEGETSADQTPRPLRYKTLHIVKREKEVYEKLRQIFVKKYHGDLIHEDFLAHLKVFEEREGEKVKQIVAIGTKEEKFNLAKTIFDSLESALEEEYENVQAEKGLLDGLNLPSREPDVHGIQGMGQLGEDEGESGDCDPATGEKFF